jgi:hypothetical protein
MTQPIQALSNFDPIPKDATITPQQLRNLRMSSPEDLPIHVFACAKQLGLIIETPKIIDPEWRTVWELTLAWLDEKHPLWRGYDIYDRAKEMTVDLRWRV